MLVSDLKRASEGLGEKLEQLSKVELQSIWGSYILVTSIRNSKIKDEFGFTQNVSNSEQISSRENLFQLDGVSLLISDTDLVT